MTVRTAYVPVAGTAITAANHIKFPGGWIGYAEVTANQASLEAGVDLTSLTVAVTVGTSRRIRITAYAALQGSVDGNLARLDIKESATILGSAQGSLTTSGNVAFHPAIVLTPSSGAHTYKLTATRSAGVGTLSLNASATNIAYILVEDIGPAS